MAKVKKITADGNITILPKSKNTTYQFTTNAVLNFYANEEYSKYDFYFNFAIKSGNNLILRTVFDNQGTGAVKTVVTIFKNFFNSPYEVEVNYNTALAGANYSITKETVAGVESHLLVANGADYILAPTKKKSTMTITVNSSTVLDTKGNDTYITTVPVAYFHDLSGNDTYKPVTDSNPIIYDYLGQDSYEFNSTTPEIYDYKGNDKFIIKDYTESEHGGDFLINDNAGKDKYELTNIVFNNFKNDEITDFKGNDKYTVVSSKKQSITDLKGNDKYNVSYNTDGIKINDGAGSDNYTLKGKVVNKEITEVVKNFQITDYGEGKDKYFIQFTYNEYEESDTESRSIVDYGGNDKYNLQSTSGIRIHDAKGKDTYNLKIPTNSKGKTIPLYTTGGIDELSCLNGKIQVYDDKGNDKYNLSYAAYSKIYDSEGKDTYNLKGGTVKINQQISEDFALDMTMPTLIMPEIHDESLTSADTYNIGNILGGGVAALYGAGTTTISDAGGNNKFNIKNAGKYFDIKGFQEQLASNLSPMLAFELETSLTSFNISCMGVGNDKYNFSNSIVMAGINDAKGNDKYSFKNVSGNITVRDNEGSDKYTISKNKSYLMIGDYSGNDAYAIDNLKINSGIEGNSILIKDTAGYDTVKVSSLKKSNIVYMANFSSSKDESYIDDDNLGLIIYDKKNGGLLDLVDFYETKETDQKIPDTNINKVIISGFGNGNIENFRAGKTKINLQNTTACDYNRMEALRETVGAWLTADGRNYSSVEHVLSVGTKEDIKALVQIFKDGQA